MIFLGLFSFSSLSVQRGLTSTGFFRSTFHEYEITTLSDGSITMDFNKLIPQAKNGVVDSLLGLDKVKNPVAIAVNTFLIKHGEKLILIDAGAGRSMSSELGKLPKHLKAAGYDPSQIDVILLTHIHADHSNGLLDEGKRVFTQATLYVNQADIDFWLNKKQQEAASESEKESFTQAQKVIQAYARVKRLKTFKGITLLMDGITAVPSPGHTRGHTHYRLESNGETLLFVADALHSASIQLRQPRLSTYFDQDTLAAALQRKKLLVEASEHHYLLAGAHLDFPGMGYVTKAGNVYQWKPVK